MAADVERWVTSAANCPLCTAGQPGRHPDRGGTHPGRSVKAGDPVLIYGDRLPVLALTDRGRGPLVQLEDDAGWRIERPCDRLRWDATENAWRALP